MKAPKSIKAPNGWIDLTLPVKLAPGTNSSSFTGGISLFLAGRDRCFDLSTGDGVSGVWAESESETEEPEVVCSTATSTSVADGTENLGLNDRICGNNLSDVERGSTQS